VVSARWVVPIERPPIADGALALGDDGTVLAVGSRAEVRAEFPDATEDRAEGVLLPGLVNAHCHLELSHLAAAGLPSGAGFVRWVEAVVAGRGRHSDAEIAAAASAAIAGLEAGGTAAVGDVSNTLAHLGRLVESSLSAVVFLELLAWDPARAAATLAWGESLVRESEKSLRPGLELRLAAHAPHSVSPELMRLLVAKGGPEAIHLAESPDEARFLADGGGDWPGFLASRGLGHVSFDPPRLSPVGYCDGLGALHPRLVAAHGVQVGAKDRERLAARGVHVVLCPRSNARLGVGTADVPALLEAGVRLALGSDSLASSPSLDVLDDAVLLRRQFPRLDGGTILRLATLGGAEALGFAELGAIEPGRRAAFAYAPAGGVPRDPEAFLLSGEARLERMAPRVAQLQP
jgi:cytosine/adenosine deaminase-related metal-dependent hydrolase